MVKNYKLYKKDGYAIVHGIVWSGWNIDELKCFLGDSLLINPDKQLYFDFVDKNTHLDIYLKNPKEKRQKIYIDDLIIRQDSTSYYFYPYFEILKDYETMEY